MRLLISLPNRFSSVSDKEFYLAIDSRISSDITTQVLFEFIVDRYFFLLTFGKSSREKTANPSTSFRHDAPLV